MGRSRCGSTSRASHCTLRRRCSCSSCSSICLLWLPLIRPPSPPQSTKTAAACSRAGLGRGLRCPALRCASHPHRSHKLHLQSLGILATLGVLASLCLLLRRLRAVGYRVASLSPAHCSRSALYLASLLCREVRCRCLRCWLSCSSAPSSSSPIASSDDGWGWPRSGFVRAGDLSDAAWTRLAHNAVGSWPPAQSVLTQPAADSSATGWLLPQRLGPALCMLREGLRLLVYPSRCAKLRQHARRERDGRRDLSSPRAGLRADLRPQCAPAGGRRAVFLCRPFALDARPFSGDPIQSQMAERFLYLPSVKCGDSGGISDR